MRAAASTHRAPRASRAHAPAYRSDGKHRRDRRLDRRRRSADGGPVANFPRNCPPTVITLHMPAPFTKTFAQRLDRLCAPRRCARRATARRSSRAASISRRARVAHLEVVARERLALPAARGRRWSTAIGPRSMCCFNSVGASRAAKAVGVILTGMGSDGAQGCWRCARPARARIGQNEATSVVYGMPKVAVRDRRGREANAAAAISRPKSLTLTSTETERADQCRSRTNSKSWSSTTPRSAALLIVDALDQIGITNVRIAKDGEEALQPR